MVGRSRDGSCAHTDEEVDKTRMKQTNKRFVTVRYKKRREKEKEIVIRLLLFIHIYSLETKCFLYNGRCGYVCCVCVCVCMFVCLYARMACNIAFYS